MVMEALNSAMPVVFAPMLFFVGAGGRLLSTWMFINSMQLICHLPLLPIYIPANMSFFMLNQLNYFRMWSDYLVGEFSKFEIWAGPEHESDNNNGEVEDIQTVSLLKTAGYWH